MNDITNDIREEVAQQLRARAEEKLESTHFSNTADNENLYELYVHQIELEMQNEELRRAQRALELSRDRYVDLYEFAPVGYLTLNTNCVIIEANFTAVTLFGITRAKLLNRHFATYLIPEDKDRWHQYFMMCKRQHDKQRIELTLCRANGTQLILQIDCLTVRQDDKLMLRITLIDITERKQAEKILLEARERLEHQVVNTREELDKTKDDSIKVNTALDVLIKYQETDKREAQDGLSHAIEETIMPFLKKLKKNISNQEQIHLIDIIHHNLQQLSISYGGSNRLSGIYQKLTPTEIQVASMIRHGLSTKIIAATLQTSEGTVSIHRKHIRKKLELNNGSLYSYLAALEE